MKNKASPCCSSPTADYVFSCSGACDLGKVADMVARKLSAVNSRKMHCLALVASGTEKTNAQLKKRNMLLIDGCDFDCGRKIFEKAGFMDYYYLRITDLGFEKGKTGVSGSSINSVFKIARRLNGACVIS